jgi:hypothetical protein
MTSVNLSCKLRMSLMFCAMAIQASSRVKKSSLFNASSMSVLPISLFIHFSERPSVHCHTIGRGLLTHWGSLYLLRCDPKNTYNLDHYPNDHTHHFRQPRFCIDLQTHKKHFNAFKDVHKRVLTCPDILSCLRDALQWIMRVIKGTH